MSSLSLLVSSFLFPWSQWEEGRLGGGPLLRGAKEGHVAHGLRPQSSQKEQHPHPGIFPGSAVHL